MVIPVVTGLVWDVKPDVQAAAVPRGSAAGAFFGGE